MSPPLTCRLTTARNIIADTAQLNGALEQTEWTPPGLPTAEARACEPLEFARFRELLGPPVVKCVITFILTEWMEIEQTVAR